MQIVVNGEPLTTEASDLGTLCAALGLGDAKIATARNGAFVPAEARGTTQLAAGDEIEIVAPRQGG
ncbi:sulfur carrier protein ThiS [Methyloligella sp. 2.7D]|uniref:sulfur carrier protein ThiS n=1 Tax=unclassified Methyloligella TaxID=2625955 RepID=UPI00157E0A4C|nr:sulfur carrier protein ThiS [Methyloligella sp. GL2]QKP76739.1 sulfur carrier protein ThiS [Methyloligella sp. GL2]